MKSKDCVSFTAAGASAVFQDQMGQEHLAQVRVTLKWYLIKKLQAPETKDSVGFSLAQFQFLGNNYV